MGTRNLTVVVSGGTHRIAQYGQWDGYPSGQGATVLRFCQEYLNTARLRSAYARKLAKWVSFLDDAELERRYAQASPLTPPIPTELSRDTGAIILFQVRTTRNPLGLQDSIDFAKDSLYCEWAYVIDLDLEVLEVYRGFNRFALGPEDRFALREPGVDPLATNAVATLGGEYQPIRITAAWSLDDLPRPDEFLLLGEEEHP